MNKRRLGTLTYGYKRHGTTTLFAAVNVLAGTVIGKNMQQHCHQEFIRKPASSIPLSTSRPPSQQPKPWCGRCRERIRPWNGWRNRQGEFLANATVTPASSIISALSLAMLARTIGLLSSGPPANDLHSAFGDS